MKTLVFYERHPGIHLRLKVLTSANYTRVYNGRDTSKTHPAGGDPGEGYWNVWFLHVVDELYRINVQWSWVVLLR